MKVILSIIKFIVITILTICIILLGIITTVSSTILNQSYITQKLEETNFYAKTYELVKSNFENYIYQSGLEEEVLNDICTQEKVKTDINIILNNIYQGTNETIDTTEISNNLHSNIDKLGIKNSKNEKAIEEFVEHICNEYTNTLIHTKYEDNINKAYATSTNILSKIYDIASLILVVGIIVLAILNFKKPSKNIQGIGIALLGAGIFNLIVCNIITSKVYIQGIKIFNDTFSNVIVKILQEIIKQITSFGLGSITVAIILIIIYSAIIAKNESKEKFEEKTTDK